MKRSCLLILLLCTIAACGTKTAELRRSLDDVASFIEDRPDSAYAVLDAMDREDLSTRALRARHAILYSMALDKNYIDLTTDSIINVAYDYYRHHGTPDDKLKAYYYKSVIARNSGDMDMSMEYMVQGDRYAHKAKDQRIIGRLHMGKKAVYFKLFDIENTALEASKAADAFMKAGDYGRYLTALDGLANAEALKGNFNYALSILDTIHREWSLLNTSQIANYYNNLLFINCRINPEGNRPLLENIQHEVKDSTLISWLNVAAAQLLLEDPEGALESLNINERIHGNQTDNQSEYYLKAKVYDALGDHLNASENYKQCLNLSEENDLLLLKSDVPFIEERAQHFVMENKLKKHRSLLLLFGLFSLVLLSGLIGYFISRVRYFKSEDYRIRQLYKYAQEEIKYLTITQNQNQELINSVKQDIAERLDLLNSFISLYLSKTALSNHSEWIVTQFQNDKAYFVSHIHRTYELSHPGFVKYLEGKGLSKKEISLCCMLCIGMTPKYISAYIGVSYHTFQNQCHEIRKKLGLSEHKSPLPKYIIQLAKAQDS